jgi:hypothetical protein
MIDVYNSEQNSLEFETETKLLFSEKQANNLFCFCVVYKLNYEEMFELRILIAEKNKQGKMDSSIFLARFNPNFKVLHLEDLVMNMYTLQQIVNNVIYKANNGEQLITKKDSILYPPLFSNSVSHTFFSFYNKREKKEFLEKMFDKDRCLEILLCSLFSIKR